ncbi:MAG: tRNA (adenosine(37)-N6)-threonylcarbamoyltransferase complex dimerization subunit type 1 TsaB [Erysipelotrichales bacterium]|nr:tRNA (adenosine(37)-N6)-threonylcarbamoyltransferase complex dimerization subunit type 1 TsaB [Erysipelotrichales bacterium]
MLSLFLDTHNKNIVEVLYKDGSLLDKEIRLSERNHSDYTVPMLNDLLKRNSLTVHDLNEIIVVNGPGSFTGVRIGVTIAKTLAYTLNIPIKTITSLECLAISDTTKDKKVTIIRDIKGVFGQVFEKNSITEPYYKSNDEFKDFLEENNFKESDVIEDVEYNFETIYEYSKNLKETNPHKVNPIYIKIIEVLKND